MAKPPIGDWCKPEDGLLVNRTPATVRRSVPAVRYYGNYPLVLVFPQLALSIARL